MEKITREQWDSFRAAQTEATFAPIYEATRRLVYTVAYRVLLDPERTQDAFQAAYARLLLHARTPEPGLSDDLPLLAARLAVREAQNLKKRSIRRTGKEIVMDELPDAADPAPDARATAQSRQLREQLETLMRVLPEHERIPLQLHYFHGMAKTDIAETLEVNKSTISRRIETGLKRLQKLAERAGLGDVGAAIAAIASGGALLEPAGAAAAGIVFLNAQAAASGMATSVGAGFFGGAILQTKALVATLALVSVCAIAVIAVQNSKELPVQVVQPTPRASEAVSIAAPTVANVPGSSISAAPPAQVVASEVQSTSAQVATATPVPQQGPMISITIASQWETSGQPAPGTTVSLTIANDTLISTAVAKGVTDGEGLLTLQCPASFENFLLSGIHPDSAKKTEMFPNHAGRTQPLVLKLTPAGTIFGTVRRTGTNEPVAGADVLVSTGRSSPIGARTNASGEYFARNVPAGEVRLSAQTDQLYSTPNDPMLRVDIKAPDKNGPFDIMLDPAGVATGIVRDRETRQPLSGVRVAMVGDSSRRTSTGPDGHYRLEGLPFGRLVAIRAERDTYVPEPVNVELRSGLESQIDFAVEKGGTLTVTVVDDKDQPVEGAGIQLMDFAENRYPDKVYKTDITGQIQLDGISATVPPEINVGKRGYGGSQRTPTFDAARKASLRISLPTEKPRARRFAGSVTDDKNNPLSGIAITYGPGYGSDLDRVTVHTGADGSYRLDPEIHQPYASLSAIGAGWAPQTHSIPTASEDPNETATVNFTLQPGRSIAGRVVDNKRVPVADAQIIVNDSQGESGRWPRELREATTGPDGRFRIDGLPGREVQVTANKSGMRSREFIASPDRNVEILLVPAGVLRGRVVDALTGRPVVKFNATYRGENRNSSGRAMTPQNFTGPEGRFEFPDIDDGQKYNVVIESDGYAAASQTGINPMRNTSEELVFRLVKGNETIVRLIGKESKLPVPGGKIIHGAANVKNLTIDWSELQYLDWKISAPQTVYTDADGIAHLLEAEAGLMLIQADGFSRTAIRPADRARFTDSDNRLTIPLVRAASISGQIQAEGAPAKGWLLHITSNREGSSEGAYDTHTDEGGHFRLDQLDAGSYLIKVFRTYERYGIVHWARRIELAESEQKTVNFGDDHADGALFGQVLEGDKPVANARINLHPNFPCVNNEYGVLSDKDGFYKIHGLPSGLYNIHVEPMESGLNSRVRISGLNTVNVNGLTEHDINLGGQYKAMARIEFPPDAPPSLTSRQWHASITSSYLYSGTADQLKEGLSLTADSRVEADGRMTFEGKFKGDYRLTFNSAEGSVGIGTFSVDNTVADHDLGLIAFPKLGAVRVKLTRDAPATARLKAVMLSAYQGATAPVASSNVKLDAQQEEQIVSGLPVGSFELAISGQSFVTEPLRAPVTISPDQIPIIEFKIRSTFDIDGIIRTGPSDLQFKPDRITLNGPTGRQELIPFAIGDVQNRIQEITSGKSFAYGPGFVFRDLPAGKYEITVEAAGFETAQASVEGKLGETASPQILMKKIP